MRVAWWTVIVIGAVLLVAGIYTVVASQNEMSYVKSCERPVACGTAGAPENAVPRFFLTSSLTVSLQEAQAAWAVGIAVLAAGLVSITYGVYVYLQGRGASSLVQTGVAPP